MTKFPSKMLDIFRDCLNGKMFSFIFEKKDRDLDSQSTRQSMIEEGIKNGKIVVFKKLEPKLISDKEDFDRCLSWYRFAKKIDPILVKNDDGNFLHDLLEKHQEFNLLEKIELKKLLQELPNSYHFLDYPHIKDKLKIG